VLTAGAADWPLASKKLIVRKDALQEKKGVSPATLVLA